MTCTKCPFAIEDGGEIVACCWYGKCSDVEAFIEGDPETPSED